MKRLITLAIALALGHAAEQTFTQEETDFKDAASPTKAQASGTVCTDTFWNTWKTNKANSNK